MSGCHTTKSESFGRKTQCETGKNPEAAVSFLTVLLRSGTGVGLYDSEHIGYSRELRQRILLAIKPTNCFDITQIHITMKFL